MQKRKLLIPFLILILAIFIPIKILSFEKEKPKEKVKGTKITMATITPTLIPTFTPTLTPSPTAMPSPTLIPSPTATPSPTITPIVILPSDLEELFVKYASEYSIDKELLKRIAKCESNFNTNAGGDLYAGLFQFAKPIWGQTRTLMEKDIDPNLRFNPEEAIRTAAFMVSQNHLGIWPVCGK